MPFSFLLPSPFKVGIKSTLIRFQGTGFYPFTSDSLSFLPLLKMHWKEPEIDLFDSIEIYPYNQDKIKNPCSSYH
jgi:hypothetical protein